MCWPCHLSMFFAVVLCLCNCLSTVRHCLCNCLHCSWRKLTWYRMQIFSLFSPPLLPAFSAVKIIFSRLVLAVFAPTHTHLSLTWKFLESKFFETKSDIHKLIPIHLFHASWHIYITMSLFHLVSRQESIASPSFATTPKLTNLKFHVLWYSVKYMYMHFALLSATAIPRWTHWIPSDLQS